MLPLILFYVFADHPGGLGAGRDHLAQPGALRRCSLVLCFFTSAVLWLLIEAEFLAIVLVLVYVGAVMVLFLFVVMMLDINLEELRSGFTRYAWLGWITAGIVVFEIAGVVLDAAAGHRCDARGARRCRRTTATRRSSARCSTATTPIRSRSRPCCCWWPSWRRSR